jgi:predicted GIY-YIG superfamily endonuclease
LAHRKGTASKYTRARGAVDFVYIESCKDKQEASKIEFSYKKLSRPQKEHLVESTKHNLCLIGAQIPEYSGSRLDV